MRNFLLSLFAAVACTIAVAAPAAAQTAPKFAYVNTQRIIAEAPAATEARQALERDLQRFQQELSQLEDEIKRMIEDYEQKQTMLSADAQRNQQQAIQQKQIAYRQRAMELEEQAGKRQEELVQPVMTRIQAVIDQIRAEGSYTMIFDAAAGSILSADPALDLTDQVLTRLKTTASTP